MYRPSFCTLVPYETEYHEARRIQERQRLISLWTIRALAFTLIFFAGWITRGFAS